MVKHHQKKKKKLSKSKKDEAAKERELRLNNLDQFAGSSDEEEVDPKAVAAVSDGDDGESGDSSDDYEQYDQQNGPRRRGGVGARKRSASVGNEADVEEDESSDDDDSEDEVEQTKSSKASIKKNRRQEEADSSGDDDDDDGDECGDDEFGGGVAGQDDEMESADEFEGGDTSLSAVASKSAGMAGAMARILGAGSGGSAPPSQKAPSSKSQSTNSTGSVILSKTKTPLQKLQEKQKSADAALREKRRQRRETNLTAMHVPLSAATSRPLSISHDGQVIKSAIAQELEEERAHRRVATRGVVALFNAISKHQDKMREEASAEHRAAAKAAASKSGSKSPEEVKVMSKRGFLDMLKTNATKVDGGAAAKSAEDKTSKDIGTSSKSKSGGWNALKDDFMMTSKLKDWDKELSDEEDSDDDDDEAGGGGGGNVGNDDWSDDDDKVSSAAKRQRVKA